MNCRCGIWLPCCKGNVSSCVSHSQLGEQWTPVALPLLSPGSHSRQSCISLLAAAFHAPRTHSLAAGVKARRIQEDDVTLESLGSVRQQV